MFRNLLIVIIQVFFISNLGFSQIIADTLNVPNVATGPVVDGIVDPVWDTATAITVILGETYDVHDPASIMDCAGCHSYNSNITVTLKAVFTTDNIYVLAIWPDPTASFTRGGSWSYSGGTWEKLTPDQSEDRISFFWPIGEISGNPYNTGGCMAKCHCYWPTSLDPHVSTHGIVDDAWLENGRGDMWHSKAARCGAYTSASGSGLTIDPATHEVTAGIFSMIGYMDDKYVDVWAHDSINGEDGGRYGDAGKSSYSHNRISDKSKPKFMEMAPDDYADAMFLLQSEIDDGECVGDATTGVSDTDAATYWPAYTAFNAIVPERILRQPEGSRANLNFGAVWDNGTWTSELSRELQTGNDDDVQFNIMAEYIFGVAEFDNSRHGYEHRTSRMYSLNFGPALGIDPRGDLTNSYNLGQSYPNPFNSESTISYRIPNTEFVNISVYNMNGQVVATLVNEQQQAGNHTVKWSALNLDSGVYFYRIQAGNYSAIRKGILLK